MSKFEIVLRTRLVSGTYRISIILTVLSSLNYFQYSMNNEVYLLDIHHTV